jgi:hypothetical protein
MLPHVEAHRDVRAGEAAVLESVPKGSRFGVVFEDDGDTGCFYGLDTQRTEQAIVDALHVYDAGDLGDAERPRYALWCSGEYVSSVQPATFLYALTRCTVTRTSSSPGTPLRAA